VNNQSALVRLTPRPDAKGLNPLEVPTWTALDQEVKGNDGDPPGPDEHLGWQARLQTALDLLKTVEVNILCLPVTARLSSADRNSLILNAQILCTKQKAFFIVDPPDELDAPTPELIVDWKNQSGLCNSNSAASACITRA
jgi:hypothetical protein